MTKNLIIVLDKFQNLYIHIFHEKRDFIVSNATAYFYTCKKEIVVAHFTA